MICYRLDGFWKGKLIDLITYDDYNNTTEIKINTEDDRMANFINVNNILTIVESYKNLYIYNNNALITNFRNKINLDNIENLVVRCNCYTDIEKNNYRLLFQNLPNTLTMLSIIFPYYYDMLLEPNIFNLPISLNEFRITIRNYYSTSRKEDVINKIKSLIKLPYLRDKVS